MQHHVEISHSATLPHYDSAQLKMSSRPIPFYIPRVLPIIKSCSHPYFLDLKAISNQTNPLCIFSTRRMPWAASSAGFLLLYLQGGLDSSPTARIERALFFVRVLRAGEMSPAALLVDRIEKGPLILRSAGLCCNPAASYFPTASQQQYHRPWRA